MRAAAASASGRLHFRARRLGCTQYRDEHGGLGAWCLGTCRRSRLEVARDEARRKAASVAQGATLRLNARLNRTAGPVLELVEAYLHHAKGRQRPRSYKETERHLRVHAAPLHHDRAETVSGGTLPTLLERIGKAFRSRRCQPCARNPQRPLDLGAANRADQRRQQSLSLSRFAYPEKSRERVLHRC